MFTVCSARPEEDGFYLHIQRGRTIRGTSFPDGNWKHFIFKNAKTAKDCAVELNTKFWSIYSETNGDYNKMPPDVPQQMVNTILNYL